ncbi:MAG TPA: hypothetical protein VMA72_01125 [Streptosporangiaceae bacterium]|nr:hypothetical protein [Streptosporangiaceae bacterium]
MGTAPGYAPVGLMAGLARRSVDGAALAAHPAQRPEPRHRQPGESRSAALALGVPASPENGWRRATAGQSAPPRLRALLRDGRMAEVAAPAIRPAWAVFQIHTARRRTAVLRHPREAHLRSPERRATAA